METSVPDTMVSGPGVGMKFPEIGGEIRGLETGSAGFTRVVKFCGEPGLSITYESLRACLRQ
jgi:hypothetical protein